MRFNKTYYLKNGDEIVIRNAETSDAKELLDEFLLTHEETDYLLSYTDENTFTVQDEAAFIQKSIDSDRDIQLVAIYNGKLVGSSGVESIGAQYKLKHRANFGISILKAYWGLGIGTILTNACISCAKSAGYLQLELEVVSDNEKAYSLYKKLGFEEMGRNPLGFNSRISGFQELTSMRKVLNDNY